MNFVDQSKNQGKQICHVGQLIGANFKETRTAFLGTCSQGGYGLYLITYSAIILADSPIATWENAGTLCNIDRFVDVNISVRGDS
ncbi:MAG TPA: hypothetical protein VMW50_08300 [Dehalococcoidia bacterium]|nr:hypothetical protein [Dehalococcoidia bacterium]